MNRQTSYYYANFAYDWQGAMHYGCKTTRDPA